MQTTETITNPKVEGQSIDKYKAFIESQVFEKNDYKWLAIENSRLDFKADFVFLGFTKKQVKLGYVYSSGPNGIQYKICYGKVSGHYLSVDSDSFLLDLPNDEEIQKQNLLKILNTKFGEGPYEEFLKIQSTRIRIENDSFILTTNTGDNTSQEIIESLGYSFIEKNDILDTRRLTFSLTAKNFYQQKQEVQTPSGPEHDLKVENYKAKKEGKIERYQELAEKNHDKATATSNEARKMADVIPFGQPILIGHHSERRDRNYRNRIDRKMDKSVEEYNKAKYYDEKVKAAQNNYAISSDDPEAIKKLKEKIQGLQKEHAKTKALPKKPRDYSFSDIDMRTVHLTSLTTEIRRCEKRLLEIQELENRKDLDKTINGVRMWADKDENRLKLEFGYKPSEEILKQLKSHGFHWSPTNQAWQRQISNQAEYWAEEILKGVN